MKIFFSEKNEIMNCKDYITMIIIIILYGILSFYKLGSFENPNTFQDFKATDTLIIEMTNIENIVKMKTFNGSKNSEYQIYVSDDNKKYQYVTQILGEGSFAWDELRILTKGKYLKLLFIEDSSLGEIALYDNNKNQIDIKNITLNNKKKIFTLTDENQVIPKQISYYNSSYFDEIYFARTAYEYTKGLNTYEWVHPPLGKLIQALPIFITKKMTPFNYRLMGNISGILMLIVMYYFGKLLFKQRKYAILSSLLMALDTFHFAQTRMGTVDSHLVLFITCSLYFMCKFIKSYKTQDLFLSGLFFSLSISVKWTGFYGGVALAIIFFLNLIKNKKLSFINITKGLTFFVILPLTVYISLYLLFPNNRINHTSNLKKILIHQKDMFNYHSKLKSNHYFSSKWFTWPVVYKPVWYHNQEISTGQRETITSVGNITIWWLGIISIIYLLIKIIKKDFRYSYLLIIILSLWLPYAFIGREMFIYHYFPVLPPLILSIVSMIKELISKTKIEIIIPFYLIIVSAFFIIYYPVVSGIPLEPEKIEKLKLFNSWYF